MLLAVVAAWGAAFSGIKVLLDTLDPYTLTAARLLVAALSYTAVLPFLKGSPRREPGDATRLVLLGLTGAAGYHLAVNWGERFISAGLTSLIVASMPAMVALLAAFVLRERLGPRGNVGVVLALGGVAVLAAAGEGGLNAQSTTGALVTLLAPFAWAIYTIVSKPLAARYDGVRLNVVGAWVGTLIVLPIGLPGVDGLARLDAEGWFWLLYLGIVSTAGAYIAYAWALRHWTASEVATFIYLVPGASLLWAWVLLDEVPTLWALLGGAIVIAGVVLVETSKRPVSSTTPHDQERRSVALRDRGGRTHGRPRVRRRG